jgi:hypothetical protein
MAALASPPPTALIAPVWKEPIRICQMNDCRCKDQAKIDWRQPMTCNHWFCKNSVTRLRKLGACPVAGCGSPAKMIQAGRPAHAEIKKRKPEEEVVAVASSSSSSSPSPSTASCSSCIILDDNGIWKCPLCWEPSDGTIPVMFCNGVTSCGHSIHKKCELEMKKFNIHTCPDCAQEWTHTLANRTMAEILNTAPKRQQEQTSFFPDDFSPAPILLQRTFKTAVRSFFSNQHENPTTTYTQVFPFADKKYILPLATELHKKGWDISWEFNCIRIAFPVTLRGNGKKRALEEEGEKPKNALYYAPNDDEEREFY